jgi:hypothetical protein
MVKGPTATVDVTKATQVVGSITMIPNGTVAVVIPADSTSTTETFTGQVLDVNGVAVPNHPLHVFENGVIMTGTLSSDANGNYTFTVTFSAIGTFTIDVSDNTSNT